MKNMRFLRFGFCVAAVLSSALIQGRALDRIERTFMDFALNMPQTYNFEMNGLMNQQARLNDDFHGTASRMGLLGDLPGLSGIESFAGIRSAWLESDRTRGYEADLYNPYVGVVLQGSCQWNVGFVYSPGSIDIESFNDVVKGDGDAHHFGVFVSRQFQCGLKLGASYDYETAALDLRDRVFAVNGDLDADGHGVSLTAGYARKFGENRLGRNIGFDVTANFLYSKRQFEIQNGPLFFSEFDHEAWWFCLRTVVTHNLHDRVSMYGAFSIYQLLDENDRARIPRFFGPTVPGVDRSFGEIGGGVVAMCGRGISVDMGAKVHVFNQSYQAVIVALGLTCKF